jgi:hypothetical protein
MWKLDQIAMDFFIGLPKAPSEQNAIWVIIDRLCNAPLLQKA